MPFQRHSENITCWYSRLSFPHIWEPKPIVVRGQAISEPKYSCLVILHDEVISRIEAIEKKLIAQSWPEWPGGQPPPGVILKRALQRGEDVRPGDPHLLGKWVLSANAQPDSKPWVVYADPATGNFLPVADQSTVYAGAEAHVNVGIYTTQIKLAEPQINVGLNGLQMTGRSLPSFDNRVGAEQALQGGPDIAAPPPPPGAPDITPPTQVQSNQPWTTSQGVPTAQPPAQPYDPSDPMTW